MKETIVIQYTTASHNLIAEKLEKKSFEILEILLPKSNNIKSGFPVCSVHLVHEGNLVCSVFDEDGKVSKDMENFIKLNPTFTTKLFFSINKHDNKSAIIYEFDAEKSELTLKEKKIQPSHNVEAITMASEELFKLVALFIYKKAADELYTLSKWQLIFAK